MQLLFENLVPEEIENDLKVLYTVRGPDTLIAFWNETQVRAPYSAGEVEDVFYDL